MWEFLIRPFEGIVYDRAERIKRKTVDVFGGYIRSTTAAALFDAVGILIGLLLLQFHLIPLAILTFLLAFIPIVGAVSAGGVRSAGRPCQQRTTQRGTCRTRRHHRQSTRRECPETDPDGQDREPPRPRRAHSHRRRHRRGRDHRSPARCPLTAAAGTRASLGRRQRSRTLGAPEVTLDASAASPAACRPRPGSRHQLSGSLLSAGREEE